jgi:hypothetical protein
MDGDFIYLTAIVTFFWLVVPPTATVIGTVGPGVMLGGTSTFTWNSPLMASGAEPA